MKPSAVSSMTRVPTLALPLLLMLLAGQLGCAWPLDPIPRLHVKHREVVGQRFLGNETHVKHFKLLERSPTFMLIGARNAIYNLSLHDLTEMSDQRLQWPSSGAHQEICQLKGGNNDTCQNYVRVFGRLGPDKFMTCGTNANKPWCKHFRIQNGNYVSENDNEGLGICPYSPHHNSTSVFADGQLYAATFSDLSGGEPLIYRENIRTERSDLNQLNGPNFVSSFSYGDYVYFFYRETAMEYMNCGKTVYSRVARVCKHDKGGPRAFSDRWMSFLKARLNCSVPGDYPFYFNEIHDGRVMKALNTKNPFSRNESNQVIVSDVQVLKHGQAVRDLQVVHLAGEASKLVVIADSEIRAVPLQHCDSSQAASCAACVGLQDPHCAWDAAHSQCVAVMTRLHDSDADRMLYQNISSGKHRACGHDQVLIKAAQPMAPAHIGRGQQQPDDSENEIVIELDRDNQYSRTQPRPSEPQGVAVTPVVYSAQTLTGALIGTCFFSLIAGFASGFWFSQRLRGGPYPEPAEQRQQLNRFTEASESPAGFNNKSINLVLNVPPKNPNGKNANSSAENKPMQKVKKTYI
ncbi:semaphorin-1A-like [Copidosoma floridanum]|uniref:semaphorin-1A-like n=1 Tax=Copidosoma floridanum TaxID=29053 RepID=UPI0006C9E33C|nr:semaphorin-1A-like [Copidosoma floridanum]